HEAASKAVARAGGITDLLQREGRHAEDRVPMDHHRAVLSALDDERAWAEPEDVPRGPQQVVLAGKLARFGVVDHQDLRMLQSLLELHRRALDPVVHRVERHDPWPTAHLREYGAL